MYDWSMQETLDFMTQRLFETYFEIQGTALKGGYLLRKYIPSTPRYTRDVDFSVFTPSAASLANQAMICLGEELIQAGQIVQYKTREVAPKMSGGLETYRPYGTRGKIEKFVGVDFSIQESPQGVLYEPVVLGSTIYYGYSIEKMLSDKIQASNTKSQTRRIKDLFDIFMIGTATPYPLQMNIVLEEMRVRGFVFNYEYYPLNPDRFVALDSAWKKAREDSRRYNTIISSKIEISRLLTAYSNIVPTVLSHFANGAFITNLMWDKDIQMWR